MYCICKRTGASTWHKARFDGHQLHTRNGHLIRAPPSFIAQIPPLSLDGELFTSWGGFSKISSIIRKSVPDPDEWKQVSYRIFDSPKSPTSFAETYLSLQASLPLCGASYPVCLIKQRPVKDVQDVKESLQRELHKGGEGVILRRANNPYTTGRSAYLLKVKGQADAEAIVTGYQLGNGRLTNVLGALLCAWHHDRRVHFRVGTGFTQEQRIHFVLHFPVGTIIRVKFMSLDTKSHKPRHPVFEGVRTDL